MTGATQTETWIFSARLGLQEQQLSAEVKLRWWQQKTVGKLLKNNQCCRGKFNFPRCFLKPPAVSNHTWKTWPSRQKSLLPIPSQKNARVFYPSRTLGCCDRRVQDAFLWSYPAPLGRCGGVAGPWPLPTLPTPQPTAAAARGRTCAPPNGDADKALFFRTEGTDFCHVITANNLYPKKAVEVWSAEW